MHNSQTGQGLMEVLVALAIAMIVLTALSVAAVTSVRNAVFAKNSSQANAYARQAMDNVRAYRDVNKSSFFALTEGCYTIATSDPTSQNALVVTSGSGPDANGCNDNANNAITITNADGSSTAFTRTIWLKPNDSQCPSISGVGSNTCIGITVTVMWQDSTGTHNSQLKTIFGNWQ